MRLTLLVATVFVAGILLGWLGHVYANVHPRDALPLGPDAQRLSSLDQLISLDDQTLEAMDPLKVDLAVAQSIPGGETIGVGRYQRTLDEWAAQIKAETDRYLYKFQQSPAEYKNSQAYFKVLTMVTVVGQDFKVSYDVKSVAFDDPRDLFVHGVIDQRRGTCVSLPVLYMALGHRLGYPIRAVALPRHLFCRWEDRATGERFNIEAANAGGLSDYPDEHYMTWPTQLDPKDVQSGSALKTLTMREFLGCKLASRGDYEWHKGQRAEAQVSYTLAHQLYPACRSIFEILASQVVEESQRYPWSPLFRLAVTAKGKPVESNRSANEQKGLP